MGKKNVPIHMPAFRPGLGSKNIYKGSSSGGQLLEGYRDQICDLSGRLPLAGSKQGETQRAHSHSSGSSGGTRILNKLLKVFPDSIPSNNLPSFCDRFQIQDIEFPTREGSSTVGVGESNVEKEASVSSCPRSADKEGVCSPPSCLSSSPSLPQPAAPEAQNSQETRL